MEGNSRLKLNDYHDLDNLSRPATKVEAIEVELDKISKKTLVAARKSPSSFNLTISDTWFSTQTQFPHAPLVKRRVRAGKLQTEIG